MPRHIDDRAPRGRPLTTDDRPESLRRGVASPTPSLRYVSATRVNPRAATDPLAGPARPDDTESITPAIRAAPTEALVLLPPDLGYCPPSLSALEALGLREILPYYLPCLSWMPHYLWEYFLGDLIGGLSLVFFQLPLLLLYALSLAHVPIVSGLYLLAIAPLIYMVFGLVPQMIVGPEAAILLIVGQCVEPLLHHASKRHPVDPLEVVVAITFTLGASLLGFGLGRFGFLDNVLLALLLKGFISGVGVVMIINALIVMLGLSQLLADAASDPLQPDIHLPLDKVVFLVRNASRAHRLTLAVSAVGLALILAVRLYKRWAARRAALRRARRAAVYIPEILIVVVLLTVAVQWGGLSRRGVEVIGAVAEGGAAVVHNPFSPRLWPLYRQAATLGFLCAMLGFFELTTALKLLGLTYDLPILLNRELVALGFINLVCGVFGALPAFGGYGRSKINAILARLTMLGAIMAACTVFTIVCLMDQLHYIPKCTLSVVTCVIGVLLLEEAPTELWFHWRLRGYNEMVTFAVTVCFTLVFLMEAGITVGLVYLLIRVIKHSTALRIQILGRVPGTNTYLNADLYEVEPAAAGASAGVTAAATARPPLAAARRHSMAHLNLLQDTHLRHLNYQALEEIEGCLIVKIPEPLTFTNTSDLKNRLKRVEMYGSTRAHPARGRVRLARMTKYIIFDLNGMTGLDLLAAQILREILTKYEGREIYSFFVRVTQLPQLRRRLDRTGIKELLMKDLEWMHYFEGGKDAEMTHLTEADSPYFEHITDALRVIDWYERERAPLERSESALSEC